MQNRKSDQETYSKHTNANVAGLGSSVPEVAGLAMDTVAQMVRHAGPAAVRPQLPLLVGSLLESLSTLEVRCFPPTP
jgi:hypothetical protein